MPTTAINALRKPAVNDSPNGPQQISNLADDVDPHLLSWHATTTARDAAITAPHDGMVAYDEAADVYYARVKGAWVVSGIGSVRYYDEGGGGAMNLTTTATAPTDTASIALPAGTYDFEVFGHFELSVGAAGRGINLHLYQGASLLFTTSFNVETAGGITSRDHSNFTRKTLASAATVTVRASASATGGTQAITANAIRAVRVA